MSAIRFIGGTATVAVVGVIAGAMPSVAAEAHAEAMASSVNDIVVDVSVNAANSVKTDANGDLLVRYYNNGKGKHLPRKLEQRAPFADSWSELQRMMRHAPEGTVIELKNGEKMPTTWMDVDNNPVATWARVGYGNKKIKHFAFQKVKGQILNRGYFGKYDCKNPKTKKPKIDMSSVTVSESFNGIWYVIDMAVGATGTVGGQVAVTCPASSASSSFSAAGKYSGVISLKVKAKSKTEAITMASGQAETSIKNSAEVRATLMASGEQAAEGTAVAKCEGNPPPPPPPPTPEVKYSCDSVTVSKGDNRSVYIAGFTTTQSGATFKRAEVNWGDGSQPESSASPIGKSHTYAGDGPYSITVSAVFDVNGEEKKVTNPGCQAAVKFDAVINPPSLDTIVKVNDVIEYSTRTIRITGTVPAGRTAILLVNTCNGGTITSNQRVEVTGSFSIDIGYEAGEVPPDANTMQGCEIGAGYERLNVSLTDKANALYKDAESTSFRIIPRPSTPDKTQA